MQPIFLLLLSLLYLADCLYVCVQLVRKTVIVNVLLESVFYCATITVSVCRLKLLYFYINLIGGVCAFERAHERKYL